MPRLAQNLRNGPRTVHGTVTHCVARLCRLNHYNMSLRSTNCHLHPTSRIVHSTCNARTRLIGLSIALRRTTKLRTRMTMYTLHPSGTRGRNLSAVMSLMTRDGLVPRGIALANARRTDLRPFLAIDDLSKGPLAVRTCLKTGRVRRASALGISRGGLRRPTRK